MASGLIRWRMSLAVSATLDLSCSTVLVRPALVCSVSRLICSNERLSVCGIMHSSVAHDSIQNLSWWDWFRCPFSKRRLTEKAAPLAYDNPTRLSVCGHLAVLVGFWTAGL